MEKWKQVEDTNYEISDLGRLRNKKSGYMMSLNNVKNGYIQAAMTIDGKVKREAIHRLVAKAFIENGDEKLTVNHIDGDKTNNKAANLEWMTQKENVNHAFKNNLTKVKVCPIIQLDLDENEIRRFSSFKEIEDEFKYDRSLLIRVCKGRNKTAYGFKWKYVNEEVNQPDLVEARFSGKPYEEYSNYLVSKEGQVYSKKTKKILKPVINANKHCYVTFTKDKKKKNFYIHVLVARIYLPNPENYSTVIHINKNKSDNRLVNLKWVKYYNQSTS
jgi:hypothetical protein